ncbi:sigma-70 family RNA polymerase sigma factor [Paenibacillus taichungensis]|uniref:RNA polymerase sigma factor n=1 Tax=Paenibacillus taichungensis TaxID=484184 RepID=UPI002DC04635|nr:sigma-70 family RNA polymerase sigma factor [Paenibacillus taichungensis]MEC0109673.1 sigma-70 family RNA polymerase sigma factor [Paenibacillus taichungensis]MEC0200975.1 sigma-70 family RNA polymerase sigma factor [Paenibacillus taichungensis]
MDELADNRHITPGQGETFKNGNKESDIALIQRAQTGDTEAFGELIHRYRGQLFRYVRALTHDSYLAEDILQDGLIRAFIHMRQLQNADRFMAWMQRIVRNQAYSHMQRREQQREQHFSSFFAFGFGADDASWSDQDSLDMTLNHFLNDTDRRSWETGYDPYQAVAQQEMRNNLHKLLGCLNEREQQVFTSYWMEQLSPQEMACKFNLTSANVYQILSRSRKKVSQLHIHLSVEEMLAEWHSIGQNRLILEEPLSFRAPQTWNSAAASIHEMLGYIGSSPSLPMVMGMIGLSFRLTILPQDIHIAGPTAYNFKEVLTRGLRHMGYRSHAVEALASEAGLNANLVDPSMLEEKAKGKRVLNPRLVRALSLIRYSIHRGIPAVVWDLNIPEFGLIYGYDDAVRTLYGTDFIKSGTIPYDHVGRGVNQEVFVMTAESDGMIREMNLRAALTDVLAHYRGEDPYTLPNTVSGLAAYSVWREALEYRRVEPNGHAYNLAVLWDARRYASEFFKELSVKWASTPLHSSLIPLCLQAEELYRNMSQRLNMLKQCFPFPDGGLPNEKLHADQAISILLEVEELERAAVIVIQALLEEMDQHSPNGYGVTYM